jgi:tetratricopeptide (TPR) repeat protein
MELQDISSSFLRKDVLLFLGAGISRPDPSSLPTADEIRDGVFQRLVEEGSEPSKHLTAAKPYLANMPFEAFLSTIQQTIHDRMFEILAPLKQGVPNHVHRYVAQLILHGKVRGVVTTNFDNLLEQALANHLGEVRVCWLPEHFPSCNNDLERPFLIKLHGTFVAPDGSEGFGSIQTTINRIATGFTPEVSQSLRNLFDQHLVVFLGYSGRDRLDIFPVLLSAQNMRVVWVDHYAQSDDVRTLESRRVGSLSSSREAAVIVLSGPVGRRSMIRCHTDSFLRTIGRSIGEPFVAPGPTEVHKKRDGKGDNPIPGGIFADSADILAGRLLLLPTGFSKAAASCFRKYIPDHVTQTEELLAQAYTGLGQAVEIDSEISEALNCYSKALEIWQFTGRSLETAMSLNDLGIAYKKMHNVAKARECYERALEQAMNMKDDILLGQTYHNLGTLYESQNDYHSARDCYLNAIEHKRLAGDAINEIMSLDGLAYVSMPGSPLRDARLARDCQLRKLELIWQTGVDEGTLIEKTLFSLACEIWATEGHDWQKFIDHNAILQITGFSEMVKEHLRRFSEASPDPVDRHKTL